MLLQQLHENFFSSFHSSAAKIFRFGNSSKTKTRNNGRVFTIYNILTATTTTVTNTHMKKLYYLKDNKYTILSH